MNVAKEGEEEEKRRRVRSDAADYNSRFGCGGPITRARAHARAQEITAIVVVVVVLNYDFVVVRLKTTD